MHFDDENFFNAAKELNKKVWPLAILSPLVLFGILKNANTRSKLSSRFTPLLDSNNNSMIRVDRDINVEGEQFLNKGQLK